MDRAGELRDLVLREEPTELDFGGVTDVDQAGLQVLVAVKLWCRARHEDTVIVASESLTKLARELGAEI